LTTAIGSCAAYRLNEKMGSYTMKRRNHEISTVTLQALSFSTCSWWVVCALALSLSGRAAPTWAQTGQGAHVDDLQEVVVTAEKRASTVQDTAISLTAVTGEELQSHGILPSTPRSSR
jgi:hypothetical protein